MRRAWLKKSFGVVLVGLVALGLIWFAWPQPIAVDLATITKGPMEVTVDDEAKTRIRDIYTVSAPLAGKVLRISRHVGDQVTANETVVVIMQPTAPSFHDVRSHEELQATAAAADAAVRLAEAELRRIEAALVFSRTELQRAKALIRTDAISVKALDKANLDVETNEAALASARAQLEIRRNERASAAASLIHPTSDGATESDPACCVQIRAPVTGRILRIIQESETVVQPGAPLIEIGDPLDLEIVADLLSTDAVQVKPGAAVKVDGWGGPPVNARVTRVDPSGFTKVSALGIEEQRVRTTISFVDPYDAWSRLGHDYRVNVQITIWNGSNVIIVPVSALFRRGRDWAVFVVRDGRAQVTVVQVGHRNNSVAEVLSGLTPDDKVVLHPSDRITDGVAVSERVER